MKILFGTGYYFPDSYGGTETYVHLLALELKNRGYHCSVVAPATENSPDNHTYEGIDVIRIGQPLFSRKEIAGQIAPHNLREFKRVLQTLKPDLFHLHSLTTAFGPLHLEVAKELGVKTVFTGHIPAISCRRGDLLYMGKTVCDGKIEWRKCTACLLNKRRVNKYLIPLLLLAGKSLKDMSFFTRFFPILSTSDQAKSSLLELEKQSDVVIAVCNWLGEILLKNGIPKSKLRTVRQAVSLQEMETESSSDIPIDNPIQVGFIGRIVPVKGLHILIEVFRKLPYHKTVLSIAGEAPPEYQAYLHNLEKNTKENLNVEWHGGLRGSQKASWFRSLDILCVPSIWLETGPIVIMEAFANSVPVIGTDRGGIRELVRHDIDGILFKGEKELEEKLLELIEAPEKLKKLKRNIRPVRAVKEQANEMERIYQQIVENIST